MSSDIEFDLLLSDLKSLGVHLWVEDGNIGYRAPSRLDPSLLERMRQFRDKLKNSFIDSREAPDGLVRMTPPDESPALFCPHALAGNALVYWRLAELLSGSVTVYAFENRALLRTATSLPTVTEMARTYVESMRVVQPRGPYALFGFSSGGLIAFEMAHQLIAIDECVHLLAMGDTKFPLPANKPRVSHEHLAWTVFAGLYFAKRVQDFLISDLGDDIDFWKAPAARRLKRLMTVQQDTNMPVLFSLAQLEERLDTFLHYVDRYNLYYPETYPGDAVYFHVPVPGSANPTRSIDIPALSSELIEVQGTSHMQVVQPPGVELVAEVLRNKVLGTPTHYSPAVLA